MRLPVPAIIMLIVLCVLVDAYIGSDIKKYAPERRKRPGLIIHTVISCIFMAVLIGISLIPLKSSSLNIITVMWTLYGWLSIYIAKIIYCIVSLIARLVSKFRKSENRPVWVTAVGAFLGLAVTASMWIGALYTRYQIEVTEVTVKSNKIPSAFDNFKIVQISDLHVATWGNDTTFVSDFVDKVNSLHPDLILFTGDIVNRQSAELLPFMPVLSRLNAPYGVYSILGNHDYGDYLHWVSDELHEADIKQMKRYQGEMGWKLLNNEHRFISKGSDSIVLIGVENWGEPPFKQFGKLSEAYPLSNDSVFNLNDNRFKILMSHNPEHWLREVKELSNVDLTLAGHTHAMQMMLTLGKYKFSPAMFRYPTWGGMYEDCNHTGDISRLYVNIGAGEVAMPARIGTAYPEITLITLKHE